MKKTIKNNRKSKVSYIVNSVFNEKWEGLSVEEKAKIFNQKMFKYIMKEEVNYNYILPNLEIENSNYEQINKYGYLKLEYIKEHKRTLYHELLIKNELTNYLLSVGKECENRYNILMENYIKNDKKLTEKNKEINQMEWVKLMNNYKNMAEEIVLKELIYI